MIGARRGPHCVAVLSISCAAAVPATSAEPELVTDRPDQTESASVISPGRVQLETGWAVSRDDEDGVRVDTTQVPGTLVRIGLLAGLELRAGWSGFISEDVRVAGPDMGADGVGDTEVGAKLHLREEGHRRPETALLMGLSLPTGDNDVSSEGFDPSFRLAASNTLSDAFSIGYNAGISWETTQDASGDEDTLAHYQYTVSLGIGISDRLGTFVELFGDVPGSARGGPAHSLDGGVTYRATDDLQLDLAGGIGLSDAADDWFVGGGVSIRFPR